MSKDDFICMTVGSTDVSNTNDNKDYIKRLDELEDMTEEFIEAKY